jgi:hypothetical protein
VRQTLSSRRAWALAALGVLSALGSYLLLSAPKDTGGGSRMPGLTTSAGRSSSFRTSAGVQLDPGPIAAAVRWHGRRVEGVVYFTAGPDPKSTDVYRVEGVLADAKRLTRSSVNFGIGWITGRPGEIVVASGRVGALDHVESLEHFQRTSSDPGVRGSSPALDTDGTLAYVVSGRTRGLDLIVKPPNGPARRIPHAPDGVPVWGPRHRLYISGNRRPADLKRTRPFIIAGFGSRHPRVLHPPGPSVAPIIAVNQRGDIASNDSHRHLTITPPQGPARRFTLPWIPLHWSPDGRKLLVLRAHDAYHGGRHVGLLNPATGDIKPIGSVTGGTINSAVWLPSD